MGQGRRGQHGRGADREKLGDRDRGRFEDRMDRPGGRREGGGAEQREDERLARHTERLEHQAERLDRIDERLDKLEARLEERGR